MIFKNKLIKTLLLVIILIISVFLIRSILFRKDFSVAIANESDLRIQDLTVKIDDVIAFNDSIYSSSIPCCWINQSLKFGVHNFVIESKSKVLFKEFSVLSFKDTYIYIGVWENENKNLWIKKRIYYFFKPTYE